MRTRTNGPDRPGPDRRPALAPDLVSGGYEATAGIPRLRLPTGFEVIGCLRRAAPSFSAFDRTAAGRPEGTGTAHSTFNECGRPAMVCWGRRRRCGSRPLCGEGVGVFGPYGGRRGCRPRRDRGRFRDDGGSRGPDRSGRWCGRGGGGRAHPPFSRWSPPRFLRHGTRCPTPVRSNRVPPPPAHHVPHDRIVRFASHFGDTPSVRAGKPGADRGYVRRPLRTGNASDRPSSRQASASRSRRHPMIGCATGGITTAQRPRMGLGLGLRKRPGSRSPTPGTGRTCRKATGVPNAMSGSAPQASRKRGYAKRPATGTGRAFRPGTGPRPGFPGAFPGPWSRPGSVLRGIGRGHPRRTRPRGIGPPPSGRRSMRAPGPGPPLSVPPHRNAARPTSRIAYRALRPDRPSGGGAHRSPASPVRRRGYRRQGLNRVSRPMRTP